MAKGNALAFDLSDSELSERIASYKKGVEMGDYECASWPHFCAFLGFTEEEVSEVLERGEIPESLYRNRATQLKRMATWVRGQMLSGKGWSGAKQSLAAFALKQDFGGASYSDGRGNAQCGKQTLNILFGDDEMSSRAGK